jgi:serine/threonine-protein kinase HipA
MRRARVFVDGILAGTLEEVERSNKYTFRYKDHYEGKPVSLTMPVETREYSFHGFPPFFDGVLPEGIQLEALLKQAKIDRNDLFGQLLQVGRDLVGNVTVTEDEGTGE